MVLRGAPVVQQRLPVFGDWKGTLAAGAVLGVHSVPDVLALGLEVWECVAGCLARARPDAVGAGTARAVLVDCFQSNFGFKLT